MRNSLHAHKLKTIRIYSSLKFFKKYLWPHNMVLVR